MKKLTLISIFLIISISSVFAKNYNSAIGVRGLFDGGITFKHFVNNNNAYELVLSGGENWFNLTGTYQWHKNTDIKKLEWYYGGGAHITVIENFRNTPWNRDVDTDLILGINGIIGIEYALNEIPIVFSLDYNPTLNFIGDVGLWLTRGSISIRYYW